MIKPSKYPIRKNVPPLVYHEGKYQRGDERITMSNSSICKFMESPFEWINQAPGDESKSLDHGSLVDCLLLTPEAYDVTYQVTPETYPAKGAKKDDPPIDKPWTLQAGYCKEWESRIRAEKKIPIQPVQLNSANAAIRQLKAHPIINALLQSSDFQVMVSAEWHDEATGLVVPLKALVDIVPRGCNFLCDLKTAKTLDRHQYNRSFFDHGYHSQAAIHLDIYNVATGEDRNQFRHIISKNQTPFECTARYVSDEFLTIGREFYQRALALYCQCVKYNRWPGVDDFQPSRENVDGWDIIQPEAWMYGYNI